MKLDAQTARDFAYGEKGPVEGLYLEADYHIEDHRWEAERGLVLRDGQGTYWFAAYRLGLTETQETEPFEDETEVEFIEVSKVTRTVYDYVKV